MSKCEPHLLANKLLSIFAIQKKNPRIPLIWVYVINIWDDVFLFVVPV